MLPPATLLLVFVGALGCKGKSRLDETQHTPPVSPADKPSVPTVPSAPADASISVPTPVAPVPAAGTLSIDLPAEIGPPAPYGALRRWQKRSDVRAALPAASHEATPAELAPFIDPTSQAVPWIMEDDYEREPFFTTPLAGVLARFSFVDNRLASITLFTLQPGALENAAVARWGPGTVETKWRSSERRWPASKAGWSASLETSEAADKGAAAVAKLAIHVGEIESPVADPGAPGSMFKMFADVGTLIGEPLESGKRVFGAAFVLESADEDDQSAEQSDARQGYADVTLPWSASEWTTVLRVDNKTGKVVQATIEGETDEYEERVELMKQLRSAFGKPEAIITDAGYQRIGFFTKTLVVTLTDDDPNWSIEIHRR